MVTLVDIFAARRRIAGPLARTPLVEADGIGRSAGGRVLLKLESLQVTRSFKSRGALNAVAAFAEREGTARPLVTASAGNHGRGLAWAAERFGLRAIVITPRNAPEAKLAAIRRHGAELRAEAADYDDAERRAQSYAREHDAVYISPYDNPDVIAGAGTVGLEIIEQDGGLARILVPIGGGGLIAGVATAVKALDPRIEVIGVEVAASHPFTEARAAGRIVPITVADTIADGLSGNPDPATSTWPYIRDLVDRIVVVPEQILCEGLRRLVLEDHVVAEGAGAAAPAAILAEPSLRDGQPTAAIVSGANIDAARLASVLAG